MPPEFLRSGWYDGCQSTVWALGMILAEMVSPYRAFNRHELALQQSLGFLSIFQKVLALKQTTGIEREVGRGKERLSFTGITRTVELVTAYDNNENDKRRRKDVKRSTNLDTKFYMKFLPLS